LKSATTLTQIVGKHKKTRMKIIFTIILSSLYLISYSQENQTEKITLTNGSTLSINLQKIENGYIEYFEVGQSELKIMALCQI